MRALLPFWFVIIDSFQVAPIAQLSA